MTLYCTPQIHSYVYSFYRAENIVVQSLFQCQNVLLIFDGSSGVVPWLPGDS